MKKLTKAIVALLAVVVLCGFSYSNKEGGNIPTDGEQMRILHFHGHRYVCYRYYHHDNYNFFGNKGRAGTSGASIVHDPNCPCRKKGAVDD